MERLNKITRESKLLIIAACFTIFAAVIAFQILTSTNTGTKSTKIVVKDGLIFQRGDENPYTGRILDTLDNKIIEYDVLKGMKTGEFCLLSLSGEFAVHGYLKNNKNVGPWRYFYSNGNLESYGNFNDDRPHGEWNWYFESGRIRTIGCYINGKQEGTWRSFDENGRITSVTFYRNGQIQSEVIVMKLNFS